MNLADLHVLGNIATQARLHTERTRGTRFKPCLTGMCAIASAWLFTELVRSGYDPIICANDGHCWIEVGACVIDVTASQFNALYDLNAEPVLLGRRRTLLLRYDGKARLWDRKYRFKTVEDLRTWQRTSGWPDYQWAK